MTSSRILIFVLALSPLSAIGQSNTAPASLSLPAGTPLPVAIRDHLPMKVGTPVRAQLIYAVYDENTVVLPVGTVLTGAIVGLTPDRTRRVHARLRADFTPFHVPVVRFTGIVLPDGTIKALSTGTATDGAPVYRLVAPVPPKGGLLARQFGAFKQGVKDRASVITGPEKGDRFKQFLYSQLPYHPERVAKDTSWTLETTEPLALPRVSEAMAAPVAADMGAKTWVLQAYLNEGISSATSKAGQAIRATVAEPILDGQGKVVVPQGSVLTGAVTQARPARGFGRAGELRFSFRQMTFREGNLRRFRWR